MKTVIRALAGVSVALVATVAPLQAQSAPPTGSERWSPFLGCWSTSSAGVIGPMVCIVPADTVQQVDFLTVVGDSVVARTRIDASGNRHAFARDQCRGVESSRWSSDGQRLYIHADYACGKKVMRQSDALIDRTHSDAFTYVEGGSKDAKEPPRIVNFIVQLDTTVFPAEVKRRLPGLRPLALEAAELELREPVSISAIVEASTELAPDVVDAWLGDRGESGVFAIADDRKRSQYSAQRGWLRRNVQRGNLFNIGADSYDGLSSPWGFSWGGEWSSNILVTPAMAGFGVPYAGYTGSAAGGGRP